MKTIRTNHALFRHSLFVGRVSNPERRKRLTEPFGNNKPRFKKVLVDHTIDAGWLKVSGKREVLVPLETETRQAV